MPCRHHADVETGLSTCYRCGHRYCADCLMDFRGHATCAECKALVIAREAQPERADEAPARGGAEGAPGGGVAWEHRRDELGVVGAMWRTLVDATFHPTRFFEGLDTRRMSWSCLVVPCVTHTLATLAFAVVWSAGLGALYMDSLMSFMERMQPQSGSAATPIPRDQFASIMNISMWVNVPFAPINALLTVFLLAGAAHLYLIVTNQARARFEQTVRVVSYAQAPLILSIVPILGQAVGQLWGLWVTAVGTRTVHRTGLGHALVAAFWLVGTCCVCCVVPYAALIAFAMTQQGVR